MATGGSAEQITAVAMAQKLGAVAAMGNEAGLYGTVMTPEELGAFLYTQSLDDYFEAFPPGAAYSAMLTGAQAFAKATAYLPAGLSFS